jgi:hypothetical protein
MLIPVVVDKMILELPFANPQTQMMRGMAALKISLQCIGQKIHFTVMAKRCNMHTLTHM